jgi:pyruvate dehydrogenase E2 component (dihydrolipoamide acetyltransferase)/2-oxoisovalerate dehydrogenase E2 component (dihydrolipoyl transacylase)
MEYRVPELGEGVYEAELVEWLVRPGQAVKRGDALAEVMTDKATIELPAPFAGVVDEVLARAGDKVEIGQVLLRFQTEGGRVEMGEQEVRNGSHPGPRTAPASSLAARVTRAESTADTTLQERRQPRGTAGDGNGAARRNLKKAAPAVRKMAKSLGIDLAEVRGNGPDGRVLIDDLAGVVRSKRLGHRAKVQRSAPAEIGTPGQRIPLMGLRRSIAEHMVTAKKIIPHYSYIDECDVSKMVTLRNQLKRPLYARGVKLTNLPFYVKAVVGALKQVPIVNASLDEDTDEIVLYDHYHVGIATATAKGLVVPVIRDADQKNLAEIAAEIERLIRAAQAGCIARDELRGGTFTISSVGNFGGLVSTPIIHHPEVGIVAIGKIFKRPTYNDAGEIVPAEIAYLSFSFDHRVVDGSIGALFGNAMIQQLQQPEILAAGVMP